MKKIIIGIMLIVILSVQSVYASTLISDQKEDEYIYIENMKLQKKKA